MYCVFCNLTYICPSVPCLTLVVLKYPFFWNGWTRSECFTYGSMVGLYIGCVSLYFPDHFYCSVCLFTTTRHCADVFTELSHGSGIFSWAVSANLMPIIVWVYSVECRTERGFLGHWILFLALSGPAPSSPFHKLMKFLLKSTWVFLSPCFLGKLFQTVSAPFLISRLNFPC